MKSSNLAINLALVILTALVMFIIGITFTAGRVEGIKMKATQEQNF